jgi:glycosyltransferase involved in cell wall biosynthesis
LQNKLIVLTITNLAGSGAEKIVLHLFDMFKKYGHNPYIILLEDSISYDLTKEQKDKIFYLTKKRKYHKLFSFFGDRILHSKFEKKLELIEKKENKKIDLILSNSPSSDRVVFFSKRDNLFNIIHTSYYREILEFRRLGKFNRARKKMKLYKEIYENKFLITVSKSIIDDLSELNIEYKSITSIYNPFNFDEIKTKGNEDINDVPTEYLISASAFRNVKRHDILLDAYKLLNTDIKLVLLCDNNKELEKMIKIRGLENKIIITGFKRNPYPYIKNAKCLILSSEREGLPTVLIESLILDTPVASTNCISGPSEILIGNFAKYLAEINNPEDLAKKIENLLIDKPLIKLENIMQFKEEMILDNYIKLMDPNK